MKRAFVTVLIFLGAVAFFCYVTGIASEVQANGLNWPKLASTLKSDDVKVWFLLPIGCVVGGIGYWVFNK